MKKLFTFLFTIFYFWVDPDTMVTWVVSDPKFLPIKANESEIHQINYDKLSNYDKYTRQ